MANLCLPHSFNVNFNSPRLTSFEETRIFMLSNLDSDHYGEIRKLRFDIEPFALIFCTSLCNLQIQPSFIIFEKLKNKPPSNLEEIRTPPNDFGNVKKFLPINNPSWIFLSSLVVFFIFTWSLSFLVDATFFAHLTLIFLLRNGTLHKLKC